MAPILHKTLYHFHDLHIQHYHLGHKRNIPALTEHSPSNSGRPILQTGEKSALELVAFFNNGKGNALIPTFSS